MRDTVHFTEPHYCTERPDEPAFIGQTIECGGEFQWLPDGTLVMTRDGRAFRVATNYKGERVVAVNRRDASVTEFQMEQFTSTDRDLTHMHLTVVYVPSDL